MNVLVTGSNGFIGSNLIKRLEKENYNTVRYVNETSFNNEIDAVIHLAGISGQKPELQSAIEHYNINVLNTIKILDLCVKHKIKKFIFASSSAIYGSGTIPFSEEQINLNQLCYYAATKLSAEIMCKIYSEKYGMDISCLRLFTVYGPGQKTEMAIPTFIKKILNNECITIFGSGYNGRDYVYIDDVVLAFILAMNKNIGFNIYNIGSGKMISLKELIKMVSLILETNINVKYVDNVFGYADNTWANINKAKKLLGYNPKIKLIDGLKNTIDWQVYINNSNKVNGGNKNE